MKTYVTFGQVHVHEINGTIFDKDCVAVIDCSCKEEGREKAFEYFSNEFCFEYYDDEFDMEDVKYFPRGLIEVK